MKKCIFNLLATLLLALPLSLCLIACNESAEDNTQSKEYIELSTSEFFFESDADSEDLTISSSSEWTVTNLPDWLEVSSTNGVNGDNILVSVTKHTTIDERNAQLIFRCGTASDTLFITQYGYIETDYVNLKLEEEDVEYQYDVTTGTMSITYSQSALPSVKSGSAIVMPAEYGYDIRVVESYDVSGNTLSVQTSQGNMTNLFRNISFTLATNPSTPTRSVDGRRVFTPSSCGYIDADGEYHELYNINTRANITVSDRLWKFSQDYSGDKLCEGSGGKVVWDKCRFDAALDGEFSFDFGEVVLDEWHSLGELQRFSYKLTGSLGLDMLLRYHYENAYKKEIDKIIKEKVIPTFSFTFMVGTIPVPITVDTHLGAYTYINAKGEIDISVGAKYDSELSLGLEWTPEAGVRPLNNATSSLSVYPLTIAAQASLESKVSYYPKIEIGVYKFVGPWLEPRSYLKAAAKAGLGASTDGESYIGWTSGIYNGMDLHMGLGLNFGIWDFNFWKDEFEEIVGEKALYVAPSRIRTLSPKDGTEVEVGEVLNAEFIVESYSPLTDNYYPCPLALVNFEAGCGELDTDAVVADAEGKIKVEWTPSPEEKPATRTAEETDCELASVLTAEIIDAEGKVVSDATLTVKCLHPHMIDLGLPSGTKWACCNVGAESPEEYGNYYTWDEAMSLPYQLPTISQIKELCNKCSWQWTTNGQKVTGPNGNSIFLPAAGNYSEGEYNSGEGYYWSSTLDIGNPSGAHALDFDDDYWGYYGYAAREYYLSVRPVKDN